MRLIVNPLTPKQYKIIIDQLNESDYLDKNNKQNIYISVIIYGGLKLLQGNNGLISSLQSWVLIPINQYVTNSVSIDMFSHLHSLSLEFHIKRKTGEILRMMDRGTSSIVSLMNYLLFSIFPTIMDIIIALIVILIDFDMSYSIIILISMTITQWRTKFRRDMNELNNKVNGIAVDSLLNFETVKYFNAENYEVERYEIAMKKYLEADQKNSASLPILNLVQNIILTLALLLGSLLCSYQITTGTKKIGDFVYFNAYLLQLSVPLNFFGTLYRMIQQNMIDMEKMIELKNQEQSVKDNQNSLKLNVTKGEIEFKNVSFKYNEDKQILNSINFKILNGQRVALVGPSGGGKSTILKLLFRFYDCQFGQILIDNQDINQVQQNSLRNFIGVVPQDTVLFNETIKYNIGYGKPNSSDEEIYEAAKMAQIHEKIMGFPQGYDTIVGERGLRLSGGEKQRVAIARTILKNPKILLLDEATSALDTTTERQIQEAFNTIIKGKTTLIIAHRLSTIVNSDIILCIKNGQVIESGNHNELIKIENGVYKEMWEKQLFEE
ncbi:P-loop containing nucleoside triphosphate hydrolase protein [Neoconidiobolus thromboides FSU 785]|nr:P-loop containing nucleoside triphosphate hydrolase protein [Neoconidiobolus thromboides FSU 785]